MSVNNKFYVSLLLCCGIVLTGFVVPTFAQVSVEPTDPRSYGMTSGRLVATLAAVLALIGVVIGGFGLARPAGRFDSLAWRLGAVAAGLIAAGVGGLRVITSGGIGTGGGRAGAIVALVLGLIAIVLGGLAMARSRSSG